MKLDSAIRKALLVSVFVPVTVVAQGVGLGVPQGLNQGFSQGGVGGDGGWGTWSGDPAVSAPVAADYSTAYPAEAYGGQLAQQAQWAGDQWSGDPWGGTTVTPDYGVAPATGYNPPPAYDSRAYPPQSSSSGGYSGALPNAEDPYATGYPSLESQTGGYAAPQAPSQFPASPPGGYGAYPQADVVPPQPYASGSDFGAAQPAYPAAGGYGSANQPVYPPAPADPYAQAPGFGGAPAGGYTDNWSGATSSGTVYPSTAYPATTYPGGDFADDGRGGSWGAPGQPVGGGYGYPGGYQEPYRNAYPEAGYAPPPQVTDNPWAGAAAGYSREPVEDFREQQRRDNPWAFDRPDPAREADRRRWREQPARPWAREGEERFEQAPAAPTYGNPYVGQGYGAPGYDYGYPGYGRGDGYHYPGGSYDPWSSWGRGLPGGNWGGWPSMPWNW